MVGLLVLTSTLVPWRAARPVWCRTAANPLKSMSVPDRIAAVEAELAAERLKRPLNLRTISSLRDALTMLKQPLLGWCIDPLSCFPGVRSFFARSTEPAVKCLLVCKSATQQGEPVPGLRVAACD